MQTGGSGLTWKRYVDPIDTSKDLLHGLVRIPGATNSFPESPIVPGYIRISSINGQRLTIPLNSDPDDLFLRLGYEDKNYADNGYYNRDNGANDQCKDLGNAFVIVTIERHAPYQPLRHTKLPRKTGKEQRAEDTPSKVP